MCIRDRSNTIHAYISQSDKGEMVIGAGTDAYTSYTQRGGLHIANHTLDAICELFPQYRRLRMLRNWGGIVDVTPDRSPIIAKTPVPGLTVNCGWGTGGFKATPGAGPLMAYTMARGEPHPINAPFTIERFRDGHLIDEAAAAASSIRCPSRKRSMVKGALIGCGSPRAIVYAIRGPAPGVALKPPVPQPQLTVSPGTGVFAMMGERSGVTSTMPPQLRSIRSRRYCGKSSQMASRVWLAMCSPPRCV